MSTALDFFCSLEKHLGFSFIGPRIYGPRKPPECFVCKITGWICGLVGATLFLFRKLGAHRKRH